MLECVFCNIISGKMPAEFVHRDGRIVAFRDINPQAPVHVLVVPIKHIPTANDIGTDDRALIGDMILVEKQVAEREGIAEPGYRLVLNCNEHSGQEIYHLHLHVLGGRRMTWPPG